MKNSLTKISLITIIIVLINSFVSFSQNNPPSNLVGTVVNLNDVQLTWTPPSSGTPQWLHWDSGTNDDSFGSFIGGMNINAAAKWTPSQISDYDGWNITKMKFYLTSSVPIIDMRIWTGPDGTQQYSEPVTSYNANQWYENDFTTPWTIDSSTELWAGLYINMPNSGPFMGTDAGPAVVGSGDLIHHNGAWHNNSSYGGADANWNIQIYVEPSKKISTNELLGYNAYRDQVQINTDLLPSPSFLEEGLFNGIYEYYVTAVYDTGESDPSNIITVEVDMPIILSADSLALVDLYNNCNGVNWNYSENWLISPVVDWQGISTSGTRVTSVSLSLNNLTGDIPESFGNLTKLRHLWFQNNDIQSLPATFGNLESLFECWMGEMQIIALPDNMGDLDSLETLSLSDNSGLHNLPTSFGDMEKLYWLGLGRCSLDSLPSTFGNLSNLYQFYVDVNNLTSLPENFGDLSSLGYLGIHNNQITSLPDSFGNLPALIELHASENNISTLPDSFGNISTLENLLIDQNEMISLCDNFGDLASLTFARLSINNISELPASFSNLASIERVMLDQNEIITIPEDIGNLSTLWSFGLSSNIITSLPESISDIESLLELYVVDNELSSLPESIGNFSSLQILALGRNNIEIVPESIGNISSLGYIDLTENYIEKLPTSFGNFDADTVLISSNNILVLPESMYNNDYDYLWVDDNNLQFGSLEPFVGNVAYEYLYDPQGKIGNDTIIYAELGGDFETTMEVTGEFNEYQWFKDGLMLNGQTSNTLVIPALTYDDEGSYSLHVTNTLVTDLMIESADITIDVIITGEDEIQNNEFSVYPNPVSGNQITINSDLAGNVQIVNMSGIIVRTVTPLEKSTRMDISDLPKGLYLVRSSKSGTISKLVIN